LNRIGLIALCIFFVLMGTSCSNKDVIEENNLNVKKISELENKIKNLQKQIDVSKVSQDNSKKEKAFYLEFIKNLTASMSEQYLLQIAKEQWKYTALVNNLPIPKNGIIEIDTDTFDLIVSEEQTPYAALPLELHNKGKISGNLFSNHIKFLDVKPSDTTGSDEKIVSSTTYTFKKLNEDNIVHLEISTELQMRLGLETNILTIKTKNNTLEVDDKNKISNEGSTKEEIEGEKSK